MTLSRLALRCDVDGRSRVLSADGVRLVTLRLPVVEEGGMAWVELDGERWRVVDERTQPAALTDHFVFSTVDGVRLAIVVDRVHELVPSRESSAADRPPVQGSAGR